MTHLDPPGGHGRPAVPSARPPRRWPAASSVEPAKFAAAHWGRTPLLSRAAELPNPAGFTDLLSPADADELLSRRGLRTPFLRVAKDGQLVPAARFTGGGGAGAEIADQVLDERVLELYAAGATLVLQGLHRIWPPLIDFARELGTAARPAVAGQRLPDPGRQPGLRHPLRHPRRVRPPGRRPQALADPPAGAARPAGEAAVGRPRRRGRRHRRRAGRAGRGARPRRRALPAPRLAAQRAGPGVQLAAPDRRRPGADPLRPGRGAAGAGRRGPAAARHPAVRHRRRRPGRRSSRS